MLVSELSYYQSHLSFRAHYASSDAAEKKSSISGYLSTLDFTGYLMTAYLIVHTTNNSSNQLESQAPVLSIVIVQFVTRH